MSKAFVNGINIHYQTSGRGPDLVLIHGVTGNMAFWYLSVLPALTKDFRVTTYDLRGHGYSDTSPSGYTSADMAADVCGLLDHLDIGQAHLLGHSFGGVIALHTAMLYPERVSNLILADPEIPALHDLCNIREWAEQNEIMDALREFGVSIPDDKWDDLDYVVRQRLRSQILSYYGLRRGQQRKSKRLLRLLENTTAIKDFRELAGLTMDKICQIKHPTLAIYGELSPFLPSCQYLKENLPNCKTVIIPTGHFHPALEPELFVGLVKRFLDDPKGFVVEEQLKVKSAAKVDRRSILAEIQARLERGTRNR